MSGQYDISTRPARPAVPAAGADLRRLGLLCAAGGLIAVAGTAWGITQDPAAAGDPISAPASPGVFQALELVWTLTHVLTFLGALGLARSGVAAGTRAGRAGVRIAIAGMALLVPCELAFIPFATGTDDDLGPMLASTAIGIASMIAGLGLVLAGVAVLRAGSWPGPGRFLPLLCGVWVFAGLTPLVIADGRLFFLGIGLWNVLLALLGLAIARLGAVPE